MSTAEVGLFKFCLQIRISIITEVACMLLTSRCSNIWGLSAPAGVYTCGCYGRQKYLRHEIWFPGLAHNKYEQCRQGNAYNQQRRAPCGSTVTFTTVSFLRKTASYIYGWQYSRDARGSACYYGFIGVSYMSPPPFHPSPGGAFWYLAPPLHFAVLRRHFIYQEADHISLLFEDIGTCCFIYPSFAVFLY